MHESERSNQFAVCYREKVVLQMIGGPAKATLSSSCTRRLRESLATQLTSMFGGSGKNDTYHRYSTPKKDA